MQSLTLTQKLLLTFQNRLNKSTTNYEESAANRSDSEQFDSVGDTLSDGIKLIKLFPMLRQYEEFDATNRMSKWIQHLEASAGLFDYRPEGKYEVSTIINSNSELYSTKLDLDNQSVIALDINRCRNSIHKYK